MEVTLDSVCSGVNVARRGTMCLGQLADSVAEGLRRGPQEGAAVPTWHDATTPSRHDCRYVSYISAGVPSGQRDETRGVATGFECSLQCCEKTQ
jgi:hypothetical protein